MDLTARIDALIRENPGQMRADEYHAVARSILDTQPRHMLVFGCGRDSPLWCDLKPRGATILFVESEPRWAALCPAPVLIARYASTVEKGITCDPLLAADFWPVLSRLEWDWVLVDAPRGDRPAAPGRLAPVAFAASQNATVLIHDVHRHLESALCGRYFGGRAHEQVHHLRIFHRTP